MPLPAPLRALHTHLRTVHVHNADTLLTRPLHELSGSFGDLGTFAPLFLALSSARLVSPSTTLLHSGLANVLTGLCFGVPLPVQPMKAIAAVAIARGSGAGAGEVAGAGLFVAGAVAAMAALGLLARFSAVVPVPVVKGVQVGAGLSLMVAAFGPGLALPAWEYALLAAALLLLLAGALRPRLPFALVLLSGFAVAGAVNALVALASGAYASPRRPSWWRPAVVVPSPPAFARGVLQAGLGQLPLTTLNSVLAVAALAEDLFPPGGPVPAPSATGIGASVAVMNLVGCWFGAMPVCHGSGGLAAQWRFGARSGASVILLGTLKVVFGLGFSEYVQWWCEEFPAGVRGLLVFLAGLELMRMGESVNGEGARDLWERASSGGEAEREDGGEGDGENEGKRMKTLSSEQRMRRYVIMMVTAGTIVGARNDGVGFIAGLAVHVTYRLIDWDRQRREGRIRLEPERG